MKKIALFGGTFNPVHIGHMAMAQVAMEKFGLDRVIFIPSNTPPHKTIKNLASARDRLQMTKQSVKGNPGFKVSDFEIKNPGKSYSIDTIKHFRKKFPKGTKLFFLIGEDGYAELDSWKKIDEILKSVTFIVVNRPGYNAKKGGVRHLSVTMPGIDISSSYVRRRAKEGKSVKYLVPEPAFRYIENHKLYRK